MYGMGKVDDYSDRETEGKAAPQSVSFEVVKI
jgi:hypothetical protein